VHLYHPDFWGNWHYELRSFNSTAHTLMFGKGGFQEAHGGGINHQPFFVEGVREALDAKGEWWVDVHTEPPTLYIYPNTTTATNTAATATSSTNSTTTAHPVPTHAHVHGNRDANTHTTTLTATTMRVIIPKLATLISVRGEAGDDGFDAVNITLKGLTLAHTTETYLQPYIVPSPGDWSIHRGGALFVEGVEDLAVVGCEFIRLGGNGIFLSGKAGDRVLLTSAFPPRHAWRSMCTAVVASLV
jgi:hypothetical protein